MGSTDRRPALVTFAAALLLASPAVAHPGHGLGGGSYHWLHYLTDPIHVAPFALAALALLFAVRARRRARARTR